MTMSRFPGMIRSFNEGLEELQTTVSRVDSLYRTAEGLSPMLKQIAELVAETRAVLQSKPVRLSSSSDSARMQGSRKGGSRGRRPRRRRTVRG